MRTTRTLCLLIVLGLIAAACGQDLEGSSDSTVVTTTEVVTEDTTDDTEDTTPEDTIPEDNRTGVNLRFALWVGGPIAELYQKQADAFAAQDPRVDSVDVVVDPFDRFHDVINVQLANGSPPDLFWLNNSAGGTYVDAGRLLDMKPILDAEGVDLSDFPAQSVDAWRRGDGVFGVPYAVVPYVSYVNKDLWAAAGLEDPEVTVAAGEWDWEYVADAAKAVVDSGARYGASFHPAMYTAADFRQLEDIWAPYGAQPWDETGKECLFNSPEMVESVSLLHRMTYTDESMPGPGSTPDFPAGDVGLMINRPRMAFDVGLDQAPFEWTVVPVPAGPAGWRPGISHGGLGVFKDNPNADIAAELAIWLISAENLTEMSPLLSPSRISLQSVDVLGPINPLFTEQQIEESILAAVHSPDASWGYTHPNWGPVSTNVNKAFDKFVFTPDANISEALESVCSEIEGLLG